MSKLEMIIRQLPPNLQAEVLDFAQFLLRTRASAPSPRVPTFRWAGALRALKTKYTSVELQHEISRWRTGDS